MLIKTDQRSLEARPNPRARKVILENLEIIREAKLRMAAALSEFERDRSYFIEGYATLTAWIRAKKGDAMEAKGLATLGKAVENRPDLGAMVAAGEAPIAGAIAAAPVLSRPELVKPGEDWVQKAKDLPPEEVRQQARERVEQARQKTEHPLTPLSVLVTDDTRRKFRRARDIVSRHAKRELSESQTFVVVTEHFLNSFDPNRQQGRPRRVGPTSERPNSRGVPAEVVRGIRIRSQDRCEIPGCDLPAKQRAHIKAHRHGGDREKRNLLDDCDLCHTLFDAGIVKFVGWTDDERPIIERPGGAREVGRSRPPRKPPGGDAAPT